MFMSSSLKVKAPEQQSKRSVSTLLVIIYTTAIISSVALTNKIIDFHGFLISGCLIVFPLLYFFCDIVAEIYGYAEARKLLWLTLAGSLLFSAIVTIGMSFSSPAFYNNASAFRQVFGMSIKFVVVGAIAIWTGGIVNAYIITKWKIFVRGKRFWLRSITSTSVGELINSLVAFPLAFGGIISGRDILNLIVVSFVFKILYALVAVVPASMVVNYFKTVKKIDFYDYSTNFNPFIISS